MVQITSGLECFLTFRPGLGAVTKCSRKELQGRQADLFTAASAHGRESSNTEFSASNEPCGRVAPVARRTCTGSGGRGYIS